MPTLAPKPKVPETVAIPADLTEFLREVHRLIVAGDEATLHESDDLLQAESAYGGLLEEGGTRYGFTYFPGEGIETKWELVLDRDQIAQIAADRTTALPLWACQVAGCGNKSSDPEEPCYEHDLSDEATDSHPIG